MAAARDRSCDRPRRRSTRVRGHPSIPARRDRSCDRSGRSPDQGGSGHHNSRDAGYVLRHINHREYRAPQFPLGGINLAIRPLLAHVSDHFPQFPLRGIGLATERGPDRADAPSIPATRDRSCDTTGDLTVRSPFGPQFPLGGIGLATSPAPRAVSAARSRNSRSAG